MMFQEGLSPRVRGNHPHVDRGCPWQRSIPACAGEPLRISTLSFRSTVYPRVCGGTDRRGYGGKGIRGLSPRVRGNLFANRTRADVFRSIPACAGEPIQFSDLVSGFMVYPRVCGGTRWV